MTPSQIDTINSFASILISFVAFIVSVIALVYTAKTYLLKSGAYIRGSYSICSDISCEDKYVHNIILENLKDRAVVIFKIYLQLGHNYFVEIDDFESDPLILKPFEAFTKEYEPLDLYSGGMRRVLLNGLLDDKSAKQKIVLSTSEGKYRVRKRIDYWDPVGYYFQNYMTEIVRPMRSIYKGKSYGSNAKFVIEFKYDGEKEEVVPVYPKDYEIKKFKNFQLTQKALESNETLENFLLERVAEGSLNCADIKVYDLAGWHKEIYQSENKQVTTAKYQNWFTYYIIGRIASMYHNQQTKRQNRLLKSKRANTGSGGQAGRRPSEGTQPENQDSKPASLAKAARR